MKTLILREVKNAIPEAEYEPSVTEASMMQSMIQQNADDMLGVGRDLPDFRCSFREIQSFITPTEETSHSIPKGSRRTTLEKES